MNTREQNWNNIDELQYIMGCDEVGNDLLLKEILNWVGVSQVLILEDEICNLWDVDSMDELPQDTLLCEVVGYYSSDYMQEILDDIKNLWV